MTAIGRANLGDPGNCSGDDGRFANPHVGTGKTVTPSDFATASVTGDYTVRQRRQRRRLTSRRVR